MSYEGGLDVLGGGHGPHGGPRGGFRPGPRGWRGAVFPYAPAYYIDDDEALLRRLALKQALDEADGEVLEEGVVRAEDILGAYMDVLGTFDIQAQQRTMDELKAVNVEIANILLKTGFTQIAWAIDNAEKSKSWLDKALTGKLPRESARKNVLEKLQWHQNELLKYKDPSALYPGGWDLKKFVLEAFQESNAVQEGAMQLQIAWGSMWAEINNALAKITASTRAALSNAANYVLTAGTGIPLWGWVLLGIGTTGVVGFAAYKLATGPLGQVAVKTAVNRYLP